MACIDAPENKQSYGAVAKQELKKYIYNQTVTLDIIKKDRYKRTLATVYLDEQNINLTMIKQGNAWAYICKGKPEYVRAQQYAQQNKIGLWQNPQAENPKQFRKRSKGKKR